MSCKWAHDGFLSMTAAECFICEHCLFALRSPVIAAELSACAQNTVTGDEVADGVFTNSSPDSTCAFRVADSLCKTSSDGIGGNIVSKIMSRNMPA